MTDTINATMKTSIKLAWLSNLFGMNVVTDMFAMPGFQTSVKPWIDGEMFEQMTVQTASMMNAFNTVMFSPDTLDTVLDGHGDAYNVFWAKTAPVIIDAYEKLASTLARGLPDDRLSGLIPFAARSEDVACDYAAHGAPTLARLCRPVQP